MLNVSFRSKLACVALLCLITPGAIAADPATETARKDGDQGASTHDIVQGTHVEGHIAFLKAELQITPAQETLWAGVAAAMREDVKTLQDADRRVSERPGPQNASAYLKNRVAFAKLRAEGEERFFDAFEPLYEAFSPTQKQAADELFIPDMPE